MGNDFFRKKEQLEFSKECKENGNWVSNLRGEEKKIKRHGKYLMKKRMRGFQWGSQHGKEMEATFEKRVERLSGNDEKER